ncbi:hypothetical protein PIB30_086037 [Stylosanthes scabra]|uniref:Uncharacterized protein n=1 Tax=Stylosanthes scabra TaxID=79078 RepID=A0ABU6RT75_9FABA|nr:hypothetical protein [Stylosanthes scabra]
MRWFDHLGPYIVTNVVRPVSGLVWFGPNFSEDVRVRAPILIYVRGQGNQGQRPYNNNFQQQQHLVPPMQPNVPQKPSQLEVALQKLSQSTSAFVDQTQSFMQETRANFKNQEVSIQNLEVQVGQIAKQLSERPPNTFPSNTIPNPREECKAVTLRSGRTIGYETSKKESTEQ